jgi:hypothetical protein
MRNVTAWLVLAILFPVITGFAEAPPEDAEPVNGQEVVLFPQGPLFFASLASPKEPRTHVTWLRLDLPGEKIDIGSVGFGDSFGLVRVPGWGDDDAWQLGISGAVLGQFNLDSDSKELINADYIIGLPLSYRNGYVSGRARVYHQSSHLGDEFLLLPQRPELTQTRINMSFEAIELLVGLDWEGIRVTAGPSYILHTDTPLERYSVQGSIDYLSTKPVFKPTMRLFASVSCHSWEETDWHADVNAKAGFNVRSPYTEVRAIQFFGEYYHGNLPFGQFYNLREEYYGAGINVSF